MKSYTLHMKRASLSAAVLASIALTACSGLGTLASDLRGTGLAGSIPGGDVLKLSSNNATGSVLGSAGNLITSVGDAVSGGGGTGGGSGLGGVFQNTGSAISTVGKGTTNGLGQFGQTSDPLYPTLSAIPSAVQQAGKAVSSGGNVVSAIGSSNGLSILSPVTDTAGNTVDSTGKVISSMGQGMGDAMNSDAVRRVTLSASTAITPVVESVTATTQAVGAATLMGQPVNNLLTRAGSAVSQLGLSMSAINTPVISQTGNVVSATGNTVSSLGGVFNGNGNGNSALTGVIAPVTGLVGGLAGGVPGGTGSGNGSSLPGAVNGMGAVALTPVNGALQGGVLAPVGNLVGSALR